MALDAFAADAQSTQDPQFKKAVVKEKAVVDDHTTVTNLESPDEQTSKSAMKSWRSIKLQQALRAKVPNYKASGARS